METVPQISLERKAEGAILHRNLLSASIKLKESEAQLQIWLNNISAELALEPSKWSVNLDTFALQKN